MMEIRNFQSEERSNCGLRWSTPEEISAANHVGDRTRIIVKG